MQIKSDKVTLAATKAMAYWLVEDSKINILNKNGVNLTNQMRDLLYEQATIKEISRIIDEGGDHVDVFFYIAQTREYPTITVFGDARIFQYTVKNYKDTGYVAYDFIPSGALSHVKLSNKAAKWRALSQVFATEYIELNEREYEDIKPWLDLIEFEGKLKEQHAFIPPEGFFSIEAQRQLELNGLI